MGFSISVFRSLFKKAGAIVGLRRSPNFVDTATVSWTLTDDPANDQVSIEATAIAAGDPNSPSAGEKAALAGTSGTPGSGNKYVTDADPRNTNARTPTAHASTHAVGQTDPVTITHAQTTGQTADDHHAKLHAHSGADGSGTVAHSATTGRTTDDHHAEVHALYGADHTGTLDLSQHPTIASGNLHPEYELDPEVVFFFHAMKETGGLEFMMEAFS